MIITENDKLLCHPYDRKGDGLVGDKNVTGFSRVTQKNSIKSLKLAAAARLKDGRILNKGCEIFFEEEVLMVQKWSTKVYEVEGMEERCILVDFAEAMGVKTSVETEPVQS